MKIFIFVTAFSMIIVPVQKITQDSTTIRKIDTVKKVPTPQQIIDSSWTRFNNAFALVENDIKNFKSKKKP